MTRSTLLAALLATVAIPALADVSTNPQTAPKGKYKVEPNHTSALFCVRHMGLSDYCGRFTKVSATLDFNGAQPDKSSIELTIDIASIDTPSAKLNGELKDTFFEAQKFPTATFKSTSIKVTGKNEGEITGNLTLHGVTKPVTLKATFNGGTQHPFANAYAVGFSVSTKINQGDYQFPSVAWRSFVGDEISIYAEAEFVQDK